MGINPCLSSDWEKSAFRRPMWFITLNRRSLGAADDIRASESSSTHLHHSSQSK